MVVLTSRRDVVTGLGARLWSLDTATSENLKFSYLLKTGYSYWLPAGIARFSSIT